MSATGISANSPGTVPHRTCDCTGDADQPLTPAGGAENEHKGDSVSSRWSEFGVGFLSSWLIAGVFARTYVNGSIRALQSLS
jgi:hypothetical protein